MNNLGLTAWRLGDGPAARRYLLEALDLKEKYGPDRLAAASTLTDLGMVARHQERFDEAAAHLQRALRIRERAAPGSLDLASTLRQLGLLALARERLPEAERRLEEAWEILRAQAAAVEGGRARAAFGASTESYAADLAGVLLARGRTFRALETLEQARAQGLLRQLAERDLVRSMVDRATWREYDEAHQRFEAAAAKLAAAVAGANAIEPAPRTRTESTAEDATTASEEEQRLRSELTRARLALGRRLAGVRNEAVGGGTELPSLSEAIEHLPADAVYAAFLVGSKGSVAILARAGGQPLRGYRIESGEQELAASVAAFLDSLRDPRVAGEIAEAGRERDVAAAGRRLFARLFPGEAGRAIASAERLVLSPDGPLWRLPFAALVTDDATEPRDGEGPAWLGVRVPISYQPSLTVFAAERRRDRNHAGRAALVVGDPAFRGGAPAGGSTERALLFDRVPVRLPATRDEAQTIARFYDAAPLTGAAATERAVRQRLPGAGIVHLATHGYYHPALAMSSGLLLAEPANRERPLPAGDDGALQAWEIEHQLHLDAELVVLSACESGRGELVRAEGLIGLARAWQVAGARSIVATRWRVDDSRTARLMVAFHRHLRDGARRDDALLATRRLARAHPATADPSHWAGFLLLGEPGPLPPPAHP